MSKELLNAINEIATTRMQASQTMPQPVIDKAAQDIASDVYMTVLWKLVTENGTQSDAIRSLTVMDSLMKWVKENATDDALAEKQLTKLLERGEKLAAEFAERGEADALAEFGLPNEEIYTTSEGKKVSVGDMHPAYMANAFRKLLKQQRDECCDPV